VVRIRVDPSRPLEPQLRGAVDAIRSGRVVAFPTDTLYGLAADPHDAAAVAAVFALKGRGSTQPLPLIAADLEQAMTMAVMVPAAVAGYALSRQVNRFLDPKRLRWLAIGASTVGALVLIGRELLAM